MDASKRMAAALFSPRSSNRRLKGPVASGSAFLLLLLTNCLPFLFPSHGQAMPIRFTIGQLAKMSDLIVVARVESIRGLPIIGRRWAKAKVTETWKGRVMAEVEYLVSAQDTCDIAGAEKNETVLLFLAKEKDVGWVIADSGRGRMPHCSLDGKRCVKYFDVVFPAGTRILDTGDEKSVFNSAVELVSVQNIISKALREDK